MGILTMHKGLTLSLIMSGGLYPTVELTRVILVSGTYYYPGMTHYFYLEIAGMWIFYLAIIPVFLLFAKGVKHFGKQPSNQSKP